MAEARLRVHYKKNVVPALVKEFAARDIAFIAGRRVSAIDRARSVATLDDATELSFELFLGVPKHRAPEVVIASGMTEDGYIPVDSATLQTRFADVYAVGDVATAGVPKAGAFAEGPDADRDIEGW